MADVFKALADPTRREILLLLSQETRSINDLAERFQMSRPAVSKHVKLLESAGLLRAERGKTDGRSRQCSIRLEALREVEVYLGQLEKFWGQRLDKLGDYLDEQVPD